LTRGQGLRRSRRARLGSWRRTFEGSDGEGSGQHIGSRAALRIAAPQGANPRSLMARR
jgi:hypothetical protein